MFHFSFVIILTLNDERRKAMSKMSITRALVELKTLDNRIIKAIDSIMPVALVTGKGSPRGFKTTEEFTAKAKESYQSAVDLMNRRSVIKGAIVKANAETVVTVGGKEMTIAQVIEKKNSIKYDRALLNTILRQYTTILNQSTQIENDVEMKLQRLLEVNFGKDSKAKPDEFDAIAKPFKEANMPTIIDPLGANTLIEKLQKEISDFESEVDFTLSEINAKTEIEVTD